MAEKVLNTRIIHKHDTEENWRKAQNFIPKQGELIVYDIDATHDYERIKMGDGKTLVNNLPFISSDNGILVDNTLSISGAAADAKVTGDALACKLTEPATGLEVGKYFRIAAIDENGHAVLEAVDAPVGGLSTQPSLWPAWTADEQKAARERMGLPRDYELIEEIICDGTASAYTREVDPSGIPYDLESVYIEIEIQAENAYPNIFVRAYDESQKCVMYDGISAASKQYVSYLCYGCYADRGMYHGWTIGTNIANSNSGGSQIVRSNRPEPIVSPIKKVLVNIASGTFFAGDKIRIYGVKTS